MQKDEQAISSFMFPVSSVPKKKPAPANKKTVKVNEQQSKDIMNNLFDEIDQQDADDLEDMAGAN